MRRNKMASMAAVALAVTAFAACSDDDDTDSPTDDGGTETPMDTSSMTVASTPTS